jgi:hypothetical protein
MAEVELEHHGSTPGQASDLRAPELKRFEQRCEPVRKARQADALRQVGGPASPWLVPCDDCELIGQTSKLRLPNAAVLGRTVDKD